MPPQEIEKQIQRLRARQAKFETAESEESKKKLESLQKKLEEQLNQHPPREIETEDQILDDTLYLYGTDYMSTANI